LTRFYIGAHGEETQFAVKKSTETRNSPETQSAGAVKPSFVSQNSWSGNEGEFIKSKNIFDSNRCTTANVMGRNNSQKQLDMNLVGVFKLGESEGAIILQKAKRQNQMPRPGQPPNFQGNNNTKKTVDNSVYKQYVLLGETLSNGYKLQSVTRMTATLTKGSETLELSLLDPSKNQTGAISSGKTSGNENQNRNRMWPGMPPGGFDGMPQGGFGGMPQGGFGGMPQGGFGGMMGNNPGGTQRQFGNGGGGNRNSSGNSGSRRGRNQGR